MPPPKPKPEAKNLDPVFEISAVDPIKRFKRVWGKAKDIERSEQSRLWDGDDADQTVREMVAKVNEHLKKSGILVHLVLTSDEDGYAVDVYDCTSNEVCEIVSDIVIDLDDLPALIRKLQQETGFIVDTVS